MTKKTDDQPTELEGLVTELATLKAQYEQLVSEHQATRNDTLVLKQLYADAQVVNATMAQQMKQLSAQNQLQAVELRSLKDERDNPPSPQSESSETK